MTTVRVEALAPAKINLGLEVIGRRPDGYHDLVTVMQAVSLLDRLTFEAIPAPPGTDRAAPLDLVVDESGTTRSDGDHHAVPAGAENLAVSALAALRDHAGIRDGARLRLEKNIPATAGLGGASADAAAALLGGVRLWGLDVPAGSLTGLAAAMGSDVPFLLRGGTALVTGRGDAIAPLRPLRGLWFVVVTPRLTDPIPRKTAALYAALVDADRSSGDRVAAHAARLDGGGGLDPDDLANAFERPLYALRPDLASVPAALRRAGAPWAALSGAGPSHYTAVADAALAAAIGDGVADLLGPRATVAVCETHPGSPRVSGVGASGRAAVP